MRVVPFILALVLALAPLTTQAAFDFVQIVPDECKCESVQVEGTSQTTTSAPGFGCVMQVLQNVIRMAITFGFVVATFALIYAGFVWMTSGTNAEKRNNGTHLLLNVFIGIFIMLGAWLLIDFVMKAIYNDQSQFGPWNDILVGSGISAEYCLTARESSPITSGVVGVVVDVANPTGPSGGGVSDPVTGTRNCPNCVPLTGFSCKNSTSCTIDPQVRERLVRLVQTFNGTWAVTEAYPPTAQHSNPCHYNGTCIDAGFRGSTGYTAANISAFAQAASAAGLRAVFETDSCALRNTARQAGVTAYCKTDSGYSHITGTHFSVYAN